MIKSISISNWKSHRSSKLTFQNGTNVLVGKMGVGKSSVLQAISFALFGTFAELKSRDLKISEVVSRSQSSGIAEVELNINPPSGLLTIKRRINSKKGSHEATVRDKVGKLLAGPNPTSVNDYISSILKIDEDTFLRTSYAMQNEIDGMLRLAPGDRKKRIDELMNLDRFETARKTAQTLKGKIKIEIETIERILSDLKSEDIIGQESILKKSISKLGVDKVTLNKELVLKEEEEKIYKVALDKIREEIKSLNSVSEKINNTKSQISNISIRLIGVELKQTKDEVETHEKRIQSELEKLSDKRAAISKILSEDNSSRVESEKKVAVLRSEAKNLLVRLGKFQDIEIKIESLKSKHGIGDLNTDILKLKSDVNSKDEQVKTNLAEMETLRKHLEELSSMEGLCPLCKTSLSEVSRTKLISNIKKELAELLFGNNKVNQDLDRLKKKQRELEDAFENYKDNIKELEEKESIRADKNRVEKELEKSGAELFSLKSKIFKSESLLTDTENTIYRLSEERNKILESKHLYEQKERKLELEKELAKLEEEKSLYKISPDKLKESEESFQNTVRRAQELRTRIEGLINMLVEKQDRLKDIGEKKQRMSKIVTDIQNSQRKVEFLDKFRNALQSTQVTLRDELILTVNEVMSSVWMEIYPYTTWSGVRLSVNENDYVLQIKDSGGVSEDSTGPSWVNVSGFASGGERMLAALAMRISFARVMAPGLSLLILDEPTHNLDETAIQTLVEVLQERISEFLDQIFIVTHEERLAESADNIIRIE